MKMLTCAISFLIIGTLKVLGQDTVSFKDIQNHLGQVVTFRAQATDFDSKKDYLYLYFGNRYPDQKLTVVVKRINNKKKIKLDRDIMIGRKMTYFTGMLIKYTGEPDSSENYETESLKRYIETDRPVTIAGNRGMMHLNYNARTAPIDLKDKLVMIITEQKQIGKDVINSKMSLY
jgi:hypothetical protein